MCFLITTIPRLQSTVKMNAELLSVEEVTMEICQLSERLPNWFIDQYKRLVGLIGYRLPQQCDLSTAQQFVQLFDIVRNKSLPEAVNITYYILNGLGWTENMSNIELFIDSSFKLEDSYPGISERITRLKCEPIEDAVPKIIDSLDAKLGDYVHKRYCLALAGILHTEDMVDKASTFLELFETLRKKLTCYSLAVSVTCDILDKLGKRDIDTLRRYAAPNCNVDQLYPEVDLRLTVAKYFSNMRENEYRNSRLLISKLHLGGIAVDKLDPVEFVRVLIGKNIISIEDVSKITDDIRYPKFFDEYYKRHQGNSFLTM